MALISINEEHTTSGTSVAAKAQRPSYSIATAAHQTLEKQGIIVLA